MSGMNISYNKKEQWIENPELQENLRRKNIMKPLGTFRNKVISLAVFGSAILIPGLFFYYISGFIGSKTSIGLGIMAGTLGLKVAVEFMLIKNRSFSLDEALEDYKQQLTCYYRTVKYMHFIVAPLLFIAYIYGFAMLLSVFEQELLGEFYVYIIYLSWVVFLALAILVGVQLRKELEILELMIADKKVS